MGKSKGGNKKLFKLNKRDKKRIKKERQNTCKLNLSYRKHFSSIGELYKSV